MGRPPISIIGFGLTIVSSEIRLPSPPASNTTFIEPSGKPFRTPNARRLQYRYSMVIRRSITCANSTRLFRMSSATPTS
jgi:hypothetical protein